MRKIELHDKIRHMAFHVPVKGRSSHMVCPVCEGGRSKERSFVVSRPSATVLFYRCYRNKCGVSGTISSVASEREVECRETLKRAPDPYPWALRKLAPYEEEFLQDKFELSHETLVLNRVKHNIPKGKYVFPLFDIGGREIGLLDRDWRKGHQKASTTWLKHDAPRLHFPREVNKNYTRRIMIVEDVVSAMKINQLGRVCCIALLGTHLNDETMAYIASITDAVTFLLDPDATQTALRYKRRFGLMFRQPIGVCHLPADPKDMPFEELKERIF